MKHLEKELSNLSIKYLLLNGMIKEAHQINVVLSIPKMLRKRVNFLHVLYARRQTMQKRIAGTKENASAIIAKNSIIMKMSVDSKTNKQEDPKQLMMKIIYSMLVRMKIVRRMLGSLTVVAQTI